MPVNQSNQEANRVQKKKRNYNKTGRPKHHVKVKYFERHKNNEVHIYFLEKQEDSNMIQKLRECYPNSIISFYDFELKPIQDNKTFTNQNEPIQNEIKDIQDDGIKDIQVDKLLVPEGGCINFDQNEPIQEQSSFPFGDDPFSSNFDDNGFPVFFDQNEPYQEDSFFYKITSMDKTKINLGLR